ncbi:MAG: signal recognition particle protein [Proteobacteria bacterium]|nr:signal recognition particle protein [Pseudomonadota bacterium]
MLETLSKGFRTAREQLAGVTELSESNIEEALRQVRLSLLEADVEFKVTKNFLERVKDKALGETVKLRARAQGRKLKVSPSQHFVKICQDELAALMGPADPSLNFAKKGPTCIMMVGLQGSGKTTTTAKLARYLEKKRRKPMLVAADVYRPAAVEQLKVLGERLALPVHAEPGGDPPTICEHAMQEAHRRGRDVVLLDTAGRLAIDEPLMQELEEIKLRCRPANIFLVVDAMMGQDAVRTAQVFHQRLTLSGVILTKLDGDARGGAALSIKAVTGAPIKFLGIGESLDKLEEFRPEGLASRILGMGDVVGLMRDFEGVVDAEQAEREAMEMLRGKFDMSDFLKQIKTIKKMGSLADLFDKMPFFPNGLPEGLVLDDRELPKIEAVIHSMTEQERRHPELFLVQTRERPGSPPELQFNGGRVKRVARGAGRTEREVHELLEKFSMMKQMMLEMGSNLGLIGKIPGLKQLAQLKQMAGLDVNKLMETMGMPGGAEAQPRRHFRPPQTSVSRAKAKHKRKLARDSRKKRR